MDTIKKVIDLHHHLDTLNPVFSYRNKLQSHLYTIDDHIKNDTKTIINLAFYVPPYQGYKHLIKVINTMKNRLSHYGERVQIITCKSDLDKDFSLGIIFHVESARAIKKITSQIPELFDLGIRGIIPVHFKDNHLGSSSDDPLRRFGLKKFDAGLTDNGHKLVELCNHNKMWLDLAHTSDETADDILEIANEVMVSHVGIRDITSTPRNKMISFYKKLAKKNGIIGITPWCHLIGNEKVSYHNQVQTMIDNGLLLNTCIGSDYGAPIKTHNSLKSSFDIAESLNKFGDNAMTLQWSNAFEFFKRALPN